MHNCIFWREGDTKSQTFSPTDILGYRLTDIEKYYVSRTVELNGKKETCFLEYLIKGIVDMYYLYSEDGNHFFFENEVGEVYSTCVEGNGELGGDGNWRQRRMQTIRPIFEAFQESPETQKKLMESNLDKKNLSELTKEYHSRVCTSAEECLKFEYDTDERTLGVKLHVAAGASYSCAYQTGLMHSCFLVIARLA